MPPPPGALPGFISRYQILEKIAEGGMGSLYLARDPAIDRLLAIKLLRRGFDTPELRDRFAREARAAGRLRHPNIVTIFDVGEHEGDPFIAMEFLAGETLHELVQAGARLSVARRVKLLEELCDGLAYAHRAGIVHRDVKPANLIVDSEGVLKILDFGIVRLEDGGATQSGVIVGTLNYMSPEQVAGGPIDHRSDIFAVGLVAYELLTGRQAFPGTLRDGLLNRILTGAMEPLENVARGIDAEVISIVERALELDPEQRYPDLARMRNDFIRARKRLEAAEDAEMEDGSGDEGETVLVTGPGVPTPASGIPADRDTPRPMRTSPAAAVAQAERALESGDYRTALTLAGRSAAVNPEDRTAALIMTKAQNALLARGRSLEGSGTPPVVARYAPPAPAQITPLPAAASPSARGPVGRQSNAAWYAGAAAVVILVAGLVAWVANTPAPDPVGGTISSAPGTSTAPGAGATDPPGPPTSDPPQPTAKEPSAQPTQQASKPSAESTSSEPAADRSPPVTRRTSDTAARPAPAADVPRIHVAGREGVPVPRRVRYVEPVYPASALEARPEGNVGVELTIGRDGRVADARVTQSIPGLDQAALAAVRQWEFMPVVVAGAAVPVVHTVTVPFTPPAAPKPAPAKPAAPEPAPEKKPAAPPPVATPKSGRETASAPDPKAMEAEIHAVLRQYQAAWESRDAAAVARLQRLSSDARDRVRETLAAAEEYRMSIDVQNVVVEPDGQRARATAQVSRRFTPRVGRTQEVPTVTSTFVLEQRDGAWVITEIR